VVGYNANPKECLDIVRAMNIPCVKGNHDEYCSTEEHLDGFNPAAAEAVNWTRKQLTDGDRQWLRDLKYTRMVTSFTLVHATLDGPQRWGYVFDKLAAAASFTYQKHGRLFFLVIRTCRSPSCATRRCAEARIPNSKSSRAKSISSMSGPWVNRATNNPKSAYVVYDVHEGTIELRRLDYDIATAQKKILAAGLPERLAERLAYGR